MGRLAYVQSYGDCVPHPSSTLGRGPELPLRDTLTERSRRSPTPRIAPTTDHSPTTSPCPVRTAQPAVSLGRCTARSPGARAEPTPSRVGSAPSARPEPRGLGGRPAVAGRTTTTAQATGDGPVCAAPYPAGRANNGPAVADPIADLAPPPTASRVQL